MCHSPFGHSHVSVYGGKFRLIHLVEPYVVVREEGVVVREINNGAREPNVPVHLRCPIVLRCRLLVRTDEVCKVGFGVKREKSFQGRTGETNDVLLKRGQDGGVGSYCGLGVPGTVVSDPGRYKWDICTDFRYCII